MKRQPEFRSTEYDDAIQYIRRRAAIEKRTAVLHLRKRVEESRAELGLPTKGEEFIAKMKALGRAFENIRWFRGTR